MIAIKKVILFVSCLLFNKAFFATVVVNAPSCNQSVEHKCDASGNCTTNTVCAFPPVNVSSKASAGISARRPGAPGTISQQPTVAEAQVKMPPLVFLTVKPTAIVNKIGLISTEQTTLIHISPNTRQYVVMYMPTIGKYANQSVAFLFYMIKLSDQAEIATLPPFMKNEIQKYTQENPGSRYVFFICKNNINLEQWHIITQTYIKNFGIFEEMLNVAVQPDGNISLLIPPMFNETENTMTKPQLYSIDIGQI